MNKVGLIIVTFIFSSVFMFSWADSLHPAVAYSITCGNQNITLGMSSDKVLSACGQPTKKVQRSRNGAQYMKIEYKLKDDIKTELKLKFSDMENKGDLKLYKIEYETVQDSSNPYKR